jgi:hypothetical protein
MRSARRGRQTARRARDSDLRVVRELSPTSVARARSTFENRVARWYARRKGCDELLRIVGD